MPAYTLRAIGMAVIELIAHHAPKRLVPAVFIRRAKSAQSRFSTILPDLVRAVPPSVPSLNSCQGRVYCSDKRPKTALTSTNLLVPF